MRQFNNIVDDAKAYIKTLNVSLDIMEGDVFKDIIIDAPAKEFQRIYALLDLYQSLQTFDGFLRITESYKAELANAIGVNTQIIEAIMSAGLDNLVSNFGVYRKPATYASGIVRFYFEKSGTKTINKDVAVRTLGTEIIVFTTSVNTAYTTQDDTTGRHYIDCTVSCLTAGRIGNVPAGTVVALDGVVTDCNTVININDFSGGIEIETDQSLVNRAKTTFIGRSKGTRYGYENLLLDYDAVQFALVVDYKDDSFKRGLGECDIVFVGEEQTIATDTFVWSTGRELVLSKQPVISITQGGAGTPILRKDSGEYANSIMGRDKVTVSGISEGASITVNYIYNGLVKKLQDVIDMDTNRIIGVDATVKVGVKVLLGISIPVLYFESSLTDSTNITNNAIESAIGAFLDTGNLGEGCDISDLISVISNVNNVDRVGIGAMTFKVGEDTSRYITDSKFINAQGRILVNPLEYLRKGSITFSNC